MQTFALTIAGLGLLVYAAFFLIYMWTIAMQVTAVAVRLAQIFHVLEHMAKMPWKMNQPLSYPSVIEKVEPPATPKPQVDITWAG